MQKFMKAIAAIMLMVAVICAAGCTKDPNNNGDNGGNNNDGTLNGLFSVSATEQVRFSQGNLQYQASTNTWRFAENQWNLVGTQTPGQWAGAGGNVNGSDNNDISQAYSGWIDLFGWGTSGWNNGNVYYQPWNFQTTGISSEGWGYGPTDGVRYSFNLTGDYSNADWGVYNVIDNGGNLLWRTLTHEEWRYLLFTRGGVSGLRYAKAKVNGVNGVILLPDGWNDDNYSLHSINLANNPYSSNVISANDWKNSLEINGAVFLPAAGYRFLAITDDVCSWGCYWSVSCGGENYGGYTLEFNDVRLGTSLEVRDVGRSVRLVCPAE